jgi:hypothetical protein
MAMLAAVPRRALTIRTRFEPTRLGREFLRLAYEVVVPIRRVRVREGTAAAETDFQRARDRRKGEAP